MAQGVKANISQEVLADLLQEHTLIECADILNVSLTTIKRYKNKYNLSANLEIAKQKNSEKHTKYKYDTEYFDKIDNLDKAYLLGFICADGFITDRNELGIGVALKDRDVISFFQSQLQSNKPIIEKENAGSGSAELRIQNQKIVKVLSSYGILPNKSLILDIKQVIEKTNLTSDQISVFLLGYFDGDGCISLAHRAIDNKEYFEMNITGTLETITYFQQYFDNHGSITKRHKDDKNNYTLQMSNNYSTIYNALSKLYKNKNQLTFYFKRKYDIFAQLETKIKS